MGYISDAFGDVDFGSFLNSLEQGGWFEFIFPFMLIYAVVFTILERVDIFADKKPVKVLIAFVFGLFAVSFDINESGQSLGDLMMVLFPGVTAFTMGILAVYIVIAMLGVDLMEFFSPEDPNNNKFIKYILGALGIIVVIYYYAKGFGWSGGFGTGSWIEDLFSDPLLYMLILFGLFFFWINSDEDQTVVDARKKIRDDKKAAKIAKAKETL